MKEINLKDIKEIIFNDKPLRIKQQEKQKVEESYHFLKTFVKDKVIYGINTGFGPMAQYKINDANLRSLQYNIIRSHSTGAGNPLSEIYVKALMLTRYQTFVKGKSGVHFDTVEIIQQFINKGIYPYIPEHGSVGASGDLVQLAHLALTLIGEGEVFYKGKKYPTSEILKKKNIKPLAPYIREGLALTNGTAAMTGIGLVNLIYAKKLLKHAIAASVMMNEIASSYDDFMNETLNTLKRHTGQQIVAEKMRSFAEGSHCLRKREKEMYRKNEEVVFKQKIQPYYSLRCIPQVLGPVWDALENTEKVLINEFHSVDDNPIVDSVSQSVYHGGNFHGDYVSFEMDKLKIAITKLTMLMERQMNYLFHDKINEILPPFVNLGVLGLQYGLQAAQFTATSTTAECQTLSNPMYIHSIPNNNDNQDIVSMGTNAALITKHVIENAFQVISIHFMAIVQAIDFLKIENKLSPKSQKIYQEIRGIVPVFIEDAPKYKEIEKLSEYLKTKDIVL
ncbi:MAG: aromatic amino acid ammonia-lyase [Bacteroidales bacterium]|jgi:histidine ammonia-lyase|nr:aromatic amino acid ammonia-lyase [Bacteroidales bacterium]MDD2687301.1 aromatic amino acid ammonia-lyase [Bacteroidales bacterium]MDD3330899.1 aromatic amino acid ammonia-lyase [Bacteroidales bacterium]MDD3691860.1 aromatic amino acid ammonia-lyase [Bacteroidales bacterium]MDX9890124.1 aromatic amino acid ammonia-lyase [Bacteroidales bacterium]